MPTLISASEARRLLESGARLIDIRTEAEFRREHVPGSLNIPQEKLASAALPGGDLVFTCRSGGRTAACAVEIAGRVGPDAWILDGGLTAWREAGGPVALDRSRPIDLMRQVQIVAGSLVLAGIALGLLVSPGFFGLSAFVGAGLAFAGLSGWCGLARLLKRMPWNRATA
ncbi:rhodanese family protein [Sandaracinobacter sp. RS1-74]|uniref:rhodanese-like domain-containing protein n=1 Tax=Sandaracinobacteroides sayramensis TaxID=2913411 RepID=UPI001EDB7B35|nr:rhodanese family protein [Sandaracinobacteroides sayramensis]MCG2839452.1 rhodanese family protein [Sandaracinobacteroides sayramensis]